VSDAKPAPPRIHITGASGCGVSTLGAALAVRLGATHLDTDDFYWLPTDPPYRQSRAIAERLRLVRQAFDAADGGWVLSGSLDGWGDPLIPRFERVVFLDAPTAVRLSRLAARERERYGAAIEPGGPLADQHRDFMAFAAAYDDGRFTGALQGRHRARHEAWLVALPCPVQRLDATEPTESLVAAVLSRRAAQAG